MFKIAESFGQYLRSLRKKKGLTLKELGKEIGLSYSYLSQLERGERGVQGVPSPDILKLLYKPLGADLIEMMEEAGHLPKRSEDETETAKEEQNTYLEEYINWIYKSALVNPDDSIPQQIREVIEKHIELSEDDNKLSIITKIKNLNDSIAKSDLASDIWMTAHELSEDELEYILSTNDDLTYKRIPLSKNDRKLITLFLDALTDGRVAPNKSE
ncbi:helix-turn-helix domain-containing protein [Paenibacillus sp. HW567]|uniref:helix-turn-helix domain-containing protein n=1 Tax=Paenibacillus sp. HW567 TaxID=1034769 RepID=UPI00036EB7D7|nr:helix-turn-helix domain-containing protein [Paenibacillus sp. HW567]